MKSLAPALLFALLCSVALTAQEPSKQPPEQRPAQERTQASPKAGHHEGANAAIGDQLAAASKRAAGEEEDDTAAFKQSASVRWVARLTGLSTGRAYWLLVAVNFGVIAVLIIFICKAKIPALFRSRTASIQKGMEEGRKASEDASRRLGEIEQRLARLDVEIASMRVTAEADAAAEEERIRATAEADQRKVVQTAEQEIVAAARSARRELKTYAAELAVQIAERRIQVDTKTDQALVRSFVEQLGGAEGNGSRKETR